MMGITAIILAMAAILTAAHALLVSLEWTAAFGTGFLALAAVIVLLMLIALLKALRAVRTKNWRHFIPTILILALLLLFLIFRNLIYDVLLALWQPIGPGGLPPENAIN